MTLRETAVSDLRTIMNDKETAFGHPFSLTDPAGSSTDLVGRHSDIAQVIDPDTGAVISARVVHVVAHITDIIDAFGALPEAVPEDTVDPWIVVVAGVEGIAEKFKVAETSPDRAAGCVVLYLEVYNDGSQ